MEGDVLALAHRLRESGEPFALVTVVDRAAPVSARVGDKALVTADGRLYGWVGGSCSRSVVLREAERALRAGQPRLVRVTAAPGDAPPAGLGGVEYVIAPTACPGGGELLLYVEPYRSAPLVAVFGDTPVAAAVARIAQAVGYRALRVRSRVELAGPAAGEDEGERALEDLVPDDLRGAMAAVVASQGMYDEEALCAALDAGVPYVALLASRRRAEAVKAALARQGVGQEALARVRSPAGLDIGAATAGEVAISILAEVVAFRRRAGGRAAAARGGGDHGGAEGGGATVRDPVCGMEVAVASARYTADFAGRTYYFCCPHCRKAFLDAPEAYLDRAS